MRSRALSLKAALTAAMALAVMALLTGLAGTASATPVFKLRVEGIGATVDPGTYYAIPSVTSPGRGTLNAEGTCVDAPGRVPLASGTALGLLAAGAAAGDSLSPMQVVEDSFGKRVCRVGEFRERDMPSPTGWGIRYNHAGALTAADQVALEKDSETLWYYGDFGPGFGVQGATNTGDELVMTAPVRSAPGLVQVSVQAITFGGDVLPAPNGTTVIGGSTPAQTVGGVASVPVTGGTATLRAVGPGAAPPEIPSGPLSLCVAADLGDCPRQRGRRIVGTNDGDSLKGSRGPDRIKGRGGPDKLRVVGGDDDVVNCGRGKDIVIADQGDKLRRCEKVGGPAKKENDSK